MDGDLRANELKKHRTLFVLTLIAIVVYIIWRTFFTLPTKYGVVALVFGVMLLVAEIASAFEAVVNYSMLSKYTPPELPVIPDDWYPEVDIFIATHNESTDMLYTTVNGCCFLDYPDKSKVHIHLCDDTARPEMEALAKELGVHYWGLSNNKNAKGGNLNNAIRQTYAPVVVTLDADMVPKHEFLMQTVPFFFLPRLKKNEDGVWVEKTAEEIDPKEKVGFVQTPQGFYNPDLFQYNLYSEGRIPGEQDLFFREINVSRGAYNACIYAGSNTLISREALEDVDYIAVDTITEDILTGMRMQKLGYRAYATSELLVQGQAPMTIKALINQRERWGRGNVDALRQEPVVFSSNLTFAQKASYISCWSFWWTYASRAVFLAAPIVTILFNLPAVQADPMIVLLFWLPYYLLFNRSLRVMSGDTWNQHWSNVSDTILFPYLIGPILFEQLGIKQKKFKITDKKLSGIRSRATFAFGIPHLMFLIGMVLSLVRLIGRSISAGTLYSPIILYWLIVGIKNLLFSIFFMWGRDNYRMAPRFFFSAPISIHSKDRAWEGEISDVSETGLAFYMNDPEYIPEDEPLEFRIMYRAHEIVLLGKIVHVTQTEKQWKYSVRFDTLEGETKRYYREYVYDRPHSLPKKLDPSLSLLDDFNLQLGKRMTVGQSSMRKLPRVHLEIPFTLPDGKEGMLVDFNYCYANVYGEFGPMENRVLHITVVPGLTLSLIMEKRGGSGRLYRVLDSRRFVADEAVAATMTQLIRKSPMEKAALSAQGEIESRMLQNVMKGS